MSIGTHSSIFRMVFEADNHITDTGPTVVHHFAGEQGNSERIVLRQTGVARNVTPIAFRPRASQVTPVEAIRNYRDPHGV